MTIQTIENSIFISGADWIAHQANCISTGGAAGIARSIFEMYPYSDCYINREAPSIPGTVQFCGDGVVQRGIINMFSQYYPGGMPHEGDPLYSKDNESLRKKWFHQCLAEISKYKFNSIAFPYKIGCGIASGNWNWYENQIYKFHDYINKKYIDIYENEISVLIYKIEP